MATLATLTVTLADDNAMTSEEASQILGSMSDFLIERFKNDSRITTMPVTYASAAITIAAT